MQLELQRELTDARFAEIGSPVPRFRDERWGFIAICSEFDYFAWPGRTAYEGQRLLHRIRMYSTASYERVAVLDVPFPVDDIAFHPSELLVAVATGSYDGGRNFQGELFLCMHSGQVVNSHWTVIAERAAAIAGGSRGDAVGKGWIGTGTIAPELVSKQREFQ